VGAGVEPCVRFSRTRLSDVLLPPAFAYAWLYGIASSEVLEFSRTAVLAQKGTRSSYPLQTREQSNAPSLRLGYVVPIIVTTMGVSDSSLGLPFPLHQVMAYRVGYAERAQRPKEVSPVPQPTLSTFRAPYPGGFFDAASPSSVHVFHRSSSHTAGLDSLLARLREYTLTTLALAFPPGQVCGRLHLMLRTAES
jgi:hypothetical protein